MSSLYVLSALVCRFAATPNKSKMTSRAFLGALALLVTLTTASVGRAQEPAQAPTNAPTQALVQINGTITSGVRSGLASGARLLAALAVRRDLLKKVLRSDPANARSYALDDSTRSAILAANPPAAALLEQDALITGELVNSVADDFQNRTSTTLYTLHTVDRDLDLSFAATIPDIESMAHREVTVRGIALEEVVAVDSLVSATPREMEQCASARKAAISPFVSAADAAPASCSTTGVQRIAVLIVTFPNNTPALPTGIDKAPYWNNILFGLTPPSTSTPSNPSTNGFWNEVSYGQTSATGSVFGPFALSQLYDCTSTSAMATAAIAAAAASGTVDFTQFNRYVIVYPVTTCNFGGLGNVGCIGSSSTINHQYSIVWMPISSWYQADGLTPPVWGSTTHELGHNLGLNHANTLDFGSLSLGPLDFVASNPGTVSSAPPPPEDSTAAATSAPISAVSTEYGDYSSIMGNAWNHAGPYSAQHRSQILGWIPKTDEADVTSSGAFTLVPAENSSGLRTLRVLRDPISSSWVWLEFHQPTGFYTPDNMAAESGNTLTNGALIHYETGSLDSLHTFLVDMTPSAVSNNFLDGTLAPGKSWSDPYSLLTLTAGTQTSSSLGITVSYDKPCASVALSASELPAAGGSGNVTIVAPSGCSWSVSSNASWITFPGTTSGSGNATVPFTYAANTTTLQRNSYITAQRQSLPVVQDGPTVTLVGVSPVQGSGSAQSFVITATDASGPADLQNEYFTIGNCEVLVAPSGTTTNAAWLYLFDTNVGGSASGIRPGSSSSRSITNCTLNGQNSSVAFNGNQMVATLNLSFPSSFSGIYPLKAKVITISTGSNISTGFLPVGIYTVVAAPAAATPVISPSGGTFTSAPSVTITDATTGASIYYTTDGTAPTTSSTLYSTAFTVSQSETVTAMASASGYSQSAPASAVFTITVAPPAISVTPTTTVAFGSVAVGSSASQNFTVQNTGGGTLTGTASVAAPFSIASGGSYSLTAGASQTVTVKFSPTVAQSYSQSVTFTGGAGASRTVTGTGTAAPAISVSPTTTVAFGSVAVGSSSTQNFTVQNTGGGTLTGTASVAAPFSIASGGSYSLAAGATQTVTVKFSPTVAQSYSQSVTFTGGAGASRTVTGTGTAASAISVSPTTTVAFGSVAVGSSSTQNFTVQNTGGGTLTGTASVAAPFSIASGGSFSLTAGASQTVTVKFSPTVAQSYSQSVTFTGGTGASRTVTGTGTAVASFTVSAGTSSQTVTQGQQASFTLTVQSKNGFHAAVTPAALNLPTGYVASGTKWNPTTVTPAANGSASSTLTIATNSSTTPGTYTVTLQAAAAGYTTQTVPVTVTVNPTAKLPTATTGSATGITTTSATLNGTVNPNGADTHVWFLWGTSSSLSGANQTSSFDLGSGTTASSIQAAPTGLNPGTVYYFQMVAQNSLGTAKGSINSFTTTTAAKLPTATTGSATAITATTATINGTVNPNGADTHVWFLIATSSSMSGAVQCSSFDAGAGTSTVQTQCSLTGMSAGSKYYFQVVAQNSVGTAKGSINNFTTSAAAKLPTVTTGSATSITGTTATINGTVNPNGADTQAWFLIAIGSSMSGAVQCTPYDAGAGTSSVQAQCSISGMSTSSKYYFQIIAQNSAGTAKGAVNNFTTSSKSTSKAVTNGEAPGLKAGPTTVAGRFNLSPGEANAKKRFESSISPGAAVRPGSQALDSQPDAPSTAVKAGATVLLSGGGSEMHEYLKK